ncbi:hypothetical protein Q3G72_004128 [Acer saccharum]|nr:hypothetical protein Q3G72_004128 [Acer saccharum]
MRERRRRWQAGGKETERWEQGSGEGVGDGGLVVMMKDYRSDGDDEGLEVDWWLGWLACRSIPSILDIYNLNRVFSKYYLRSTIAA